MDIQSALMNTLPNLHQQMLLNAIDFYTDTAFETYGVSADDADKILALRHLLKTIKVTSSPSELQTVDLVAVSQIAQHWTSAQRQIALEALEHYYYEARSAYTDGSGQSSPQQNAVAELQQCFMDMQQVADRIAENHQMQQAVDTLLQLPLKKHRPELDGFEFD